MSFEVFVVAADESRLRPRMSDVLAAFEGHIRTLPGDYLVIGDVGGPSCEISADWGPDGDPEQTLITIDEPFPAEWLWEGVLGLLRRFDVFLMVPDAPHAWGALARADATVPPEVMASYGFVDVESADELIRTFQSPPHRPVSRDIPRR